MAKPDKKPKGWLVGQKQVDDWQNLANRQVVQKEYDAAQRTIRRIMRYIPKNDIVYAESLGSLATIHALQHEFEESYRLFSEALEIDPENAYLYYNRGLTARFTSRTGQSLLDLEYAADLEGDGNMAQKFQEALELGRKIALSEIQLRGPGFTVEQLIEQQALFQRGLTLSQEGKWQDSQACFKDSIAMGDCLPQPWGNLAICHLMLDQFDEAQAAFEHALEIDPEYALALENMKNLDYWRKHPEEKPVFRVNSPFQDVETDLTMI
jgi:tetratricopeptide (TPR) repeat protein